jgi:hypothetical protein
MPSCWYASCGWVSSSTKGGHDPDPQSPQPHTNQPYRSPGAPESRSRLLGSPTNPAVLPVSKSRPLALLRVSCLRCFPPPRDGPARSIPLNSSVPCHAVLIMAGWDWGIFVPMGIPAVGAGASSSVGAASSTFWRLRGRRCMASAWRLRCWCGRRERWPKGSGSGRWPVSLRSTQTPRCNG